MQVGQSSSAVISCQIGVPSDSILGPILFICYVLLIGRLINSNGVDYHRYVDDTQLFAAFQSDTDRGLDRVCKCTAALKNWFCCNNLLLNRNKSDAVLLVQGRDLASHKYPPSSY